MAIQLANPKSVLPTFEPGDTVELAVATMEFVPAISDHRKKLKINRGEKLVADKVYWSDKDDGYVVEFVGKGGRYYTEFFKLSA